jgi:hypothetical protein
VHITAILGIFEYRLRRDLAQGHRDFVARDDAPRLRRHRPHILEPAESTEMALCRGFGRLGIEHAFEPRPIQRRDPGVEPVRAEIDMLGEQAFEPRGRKLRKLREGLARLGDPYRIATHRRGRGGKVLQHIVGERLGARRHPQPGGVDFQIVLAQHMLRGADIGDQGVLCDHVEIGETLVAREAEHVLLERSEQRVAQQRIEQRRGPCHAGAIRAREPLGLQVGAARGRKPLQVVTRSVERPDGIALRERDARIAIHDWRLPRLGVVEESDLGEQRVLRTELGGEADRGEACGTRCGQSREPSADRHCGGTAEPQALLDVSVRHGFARRELG